MINNELKRALNILFGNIYDDLHEIEERFSDHIDDSIANISSLTDQQDGDRPRQSRISFTFREVANAIKKPSFLRF